MIRALKTQICFCEFNAYLLMIRINLVKGKILDLYPVFKIQNNLLNLHARVVNSQRIFCSQTTGINIGIKAFWYTKISLNFPPLPNEFIITNIKFTVILLNQRKFKDIPVYHKALILILIPVV